MKISWNMDILCGFMLILTIWVFLIGSVMFFSRGNLFHANRNLLKTFLILFILMYFIFLRNPILSFYILFERVFLIMFLLIINWGYSPERFQSSMYMLFYTLIFSLPFLIFVFFNERLIRDFFFRGFPVNNFLAWEFIILIVFLIKIPMFLFHLWLPKAHVEAPIFGSIVLAGILLKIGGFGISRLLNVFKYSPKAFISLLLFSCLSVSICVIFQRDIKSIIAYSSVAHIVLVVLGIFSFSFEGNSGMILLIVSHGIISSSLFIISFFLYEEIGSRRTLTLDNINIFRILRFWFFLFIMLSLSLPLTTSFFREVITVLSTVLFWSWEVFLFLFVLFVFGMYGILIFFILSIGGRKKLLENYSRMKERLIFFLLRWPIFLAYFIINFF